MRKVVFLASPEHAGQKLELAASRTAAEQLGLDVSYHEARTPAELAAALPQILAVKPDGVLLFSDALMVGQRDSLASFFLKHRIPSAAGWVASRRAVTSSRTGRNGTPWRRLAYFVDRIIKGTGAPRRPAGRAAQRHGACRQSAHGHGHGPSTAARRCSAPTA